MIKAVALISGGLDSLLAAKLILEQGIVVEGLNFFTGFTGEGSNVVNRKDAGATTYGAAWVAKQLGIKLHVIDAVAEFQQVLLKPKYGYGAHLNPCLDCKVFMVEQAKLWMELNGFDFLITGEVIGQRPMSQRKDTLPIVAKNTDDLLVRPLSAKLLPITLPERNGWVNRDLLCDFSGRTRKPQLQLAAKLGFNEYPQPAGGCCLTDCSYCARLQDLWDTNGRVVHDLDTLLLLKVGRHLRINSNLKFIVGRDAADNEVLLRYQNRFVWAQSADCPGAVVLVDGDFEEVTSSINDSQNLLAKVAAYYSKGRLCQDVKVAVHLPNVPESLIFTVNPLVAEEFSRIECF